MFLYLVKPKIILVLVALRIIAGLACCFLCSIVVLDLAHKNLCMSKLTYGNCRKGLVAFEEYLYMFSNFE